MTNSELKAKLQSSLDFLKEELSYVRTGRATPTMLDEIKVNAYGSMLTLKEVGTLSVLDAQTLSVVPWDKSLLKEIAKAIRESQLKLNPAEQGGSVIVPIPQLTEERRLEFVKIVSVKVEECKVAIRHVRNDAMKDIDQAFARKEFGEDEKFSFKEEVEDTVKDFISKADELGDSKKQDLLAK
ncbi:ribosome recycling factor [Candidatus Nomurabacteria bacterium]|uniref:Ribosome recycling factor n=1 Tax=candidate division WWE3 bacterium TaxID=2053526 RepID=A0A955E0C7_UNCKA|nr:ribosome recycling factor [candidate division WWE3 bacterium]MCB9823658.1 ribosome recycling factor [Candidatus Nomurabacteria bacterium]MCB9827264.1 ribosome recycling factor [Candidatus Nomurabacteria bacterium]MCB9827453.1 ribosome recycling factor [Candidatus Nomurabacteria bacterium]HXK52866.1 ribosome recycling factor [bacterium]